MALKLESLPRRIWIPALLLLLVLIGTRLTDLGAKPYHHDESIHAVEAWRYAREGVYRFNPMLHGPLLYHLLGGAYTIFPQNNVTGRAVVALLGILALLEGMLLLRGKEWVNRLTWLGLATLSPVLCYYSRTLIHDLPMIFLTLWFLNSATTFWSTRKNGWFVSTMGVFSLMVCTKLTFLLAGFCFATFLLPWLLWGPTSFRETFREKFPRSWIPWAVGTAVAVLIYCTFYSSLFRHAAGIRDGIFESVSYWAHQNKIQRIKGPFDYYLPILLTYELPLLLILIGASVRAASTQKKVATRGLLALIAVAITTTHFWPYLAGRMAKIHLEQPGQVVVALAAVGIGALLCRHHLRRKETWEAFFAHWGVVAFLLYSYAGEKVPWLTVHILVPWLLYAALLLPQLVRPFLETEGKRALLVAFSSCIIGWQGFVLYRACFVGPADPRERLVYTHTSTDIVHIVDAIDRLAKTKGVLEKFPIQYTGNAVWPLYWYLNRYTAGYRVTAKLDEDSAVIVDDWGKISLSDPNVTKNYHVFRRKLREWWVPDASKAGPKEWVRYYLFREVFNPTGSQDIAVLVRNDLWKEYLEAEGGKE